MQRPKKFRKKKKILSLPENQHASNNLKAEIPKIDEESNEKILLDSKQGLSVPTQNVPKKSPQNNIYKYKGGGSNKKKQHRALFVPLRSYLHLFHATIYNTYIPHIYRIITSRLFRFGILIFSVALLVCIVSINLFYVRSGFNEYTIEVLLHYSDPGVHVKLATVFFENNDFIHAQQELLIAQKLSPHNKNVEGQLQLVSFLLVKPREISSEIIKWEKIVVEKPNYRDGYFNLAILYYQVFNKDLARKYVEKTLELDPNFHPAVQFLELLSH